MNTDFKQLVDNYMLDHRVRFQEYIAQTDLYDQNGLPNINYIIEQAKRDVGRLKHTLDEESVRSLKNQVFNAAKKNDNKTVLYLLFFYFIVFLNTTPDQTVMLAINENTFDTYCHALPYLI